MNEDYRNYGIVMVTSCIWLTKLSGKIISRLQVLNAVKNYLIKLIADKTNSKKSELQKQH